MDNILLFAYFKSTKWINYAGCYRTWTVIAYRPESNAHEKWCNTEHGRYNTVPDIGEFVEITSWCEKECRLTSSYSENEIFSWKRKKAAKENRIAFHSFYLHNYSGYPGT